MLAVQAEHRGEYCLAKRYVDKGLEVVPDHPDLLVVQREAGYAARIRASSADADSWDGTDDGVRARGRRSRHCGQSVAGGEVPVVIGWHDPAAYCQADRQNCRTHDQRVPWCRAILP